MGFSHGMTGRWTQSLKRAGVVAVLLAAGWVQAQTGPVRILVGFPAGGGTDAIARTLADKLKDQLGVAVVVETKPAPAARLLPKRSRPQRRMATLFF